MYPYEQTNTLRAQIVGFGSGFSKSLDRVEDSWGGGGKEKHCTSLLDVGARSIHYRASYKTQVGGNK